MSRLPVLTGLSAILLGMIYVTAFIYFGAFFAYPADAPPPEKLQYLADHQTALSLVYFAIYVVFGFLCRILWLIPYT